ncbi:MAG: glycine zipper 2TM domain-containing protein [Burkholderiales bacterium]|nr:glycine zipper 2TM domain-containing protein [Burkholderiales bacterium]
MNAINTFFASCLASLALCLLPAAHASAHDHDEHHDRGHHYGECKHHHHHKHHRCYEDYPQTRVVTQYVPVPVTQVTQVTRVVPAPQVVTTYTNTVCMNCGVVQSVNTITVPAGTTGTGAVTGAVVGGLLGNQIGGGDGRKLATVAGVVTGGLVGNEIERQNSRAYNRYDVKIRMDNGSIVSYSFDQVPSWHRGEKVWVENGQISRRR